MALAQISADARRRGNQAMGGRLTWRGATSSREGSAGIGANAWRIGASRVIATLGSMLQCCLQSQLSPLAHDEGALSASPASHCRLVSCSWQQSCVLSPASISIVIACIGMAIAVADHTEPTAPAIRVRHSSRGSRMRGTGFRLGSRAEP